MQKFPVLFSLMMVFLLPAAVGMNVGEKYRFKVKDASVFFGKRKVGFSARNVPEGVPYFVKGRQVVVWMAKNKRLVGKGGLSIPFAEELPTQINFQNRKGSDGAAVYRFPFEDEPLKVSLTFTRTVGKKEVSVYYTLDRVFASRVPLRAWREGSEFP